LFAWVWLDALQDEVVMSEWIDVDKHLPAEDLDCLASGGEDVFIAWHHNGFWFFQDTHDTVYVTHWQPLPEPPQT